MDWIPHFMFISAGRSSIRRDDTQQWKLVAGEMVDILNTVRHAGKLGKSTHINKLCTVFLL